MAFDDRPAAAIRLEQARSQRFKTASAACVFFGWNYSTYAQHESGIRGIGRAATKYAQAFRVSEAWLLTGEGDGPQDAHAAPAKPLPSRRNLSIPDLAIFAGMGGGGLMEVEVDGDGAPIDPDQIRGYWELPEYMLRRFGDLKNVYAWEVRGDSMLPTIAGGSVVFVDISQTRLPPDDIYAVNYGDGLVVKRLKLIPRTDQVSVISDNERYGSDDLLRDDVKVWGRVIGWFQWRQ